MFGIDMGYLVWGIGFALSGLEAIYSLLNRWAAPIAGLFRPFRVCNVFVGTKKKSRSVILTGILLSM
jgi:hypothetical protein